MSHEETRIPRVLFLFPSLEDRGGVVTFSKALLQHSKEKFSFEHFVIGNVVGNKSFIKRMLNFCRHYRLLKKTLKKQNYDLIHLNPTFGLFSIIRDSCYLSAVLRSGYAGKVIVFFHGWNPVLVKKISLIFFLKRRFRYLYQQTGVIFVLSRSFKEQLVGLGINPGKIKVTTTFYTTRELDKYKGKPERKINILFMSRMIKNKGALTAADVGALLVQHGITDFFMTIAGDGPEFEELKQVIKAGNLSEYITMPGFVEGKEKDELLQNSDIFLFPSLLNEGCPIVLLEAMGAGLAVVSTPQGAIPDIVEDGINGFIIPNGSAQDFFSAILKLFNNRELLEIIQLENSRKAKSDYSAARVIENIVLEYRKILSG